MADDHKDEGSAWNQFMPYTNNLYEIDKALDNATLNNEWENKYNLLVRLYTKLHPLMNDKDKELQETFFILCEDKYKALRNARIKGIKMINSDIIDAFNVWEINLRDLWHKKIPLVPSKNDPAYAMLSGSY